MDSIAVEINPTASLNYIFPLGNMGEKHPGYACTARWLSMLLRSSVSVPWLSALHLS